MAAPTDHVDDHHQPATGESPSASPKPAGGGHDDPSVSPDRDDPTRLLIQLLASTALGTPPTAAPNQADQPQAAAAVAVGASVSSTAGNCPGVVTPTDSDDLTETLTQAFATTTLETAAAAAVANNKSAPGVSESPPVQAIPNTPAAAAKKKKPALSRAERKARRRMRLRLVRVPADYLRAAQESSDRRRRRELVKRGVGRLFAVFGDRASERSISAMMARLTTTTTLETAASGGDDDTTVSAAAPSPEHARLADLLEKMALSKKH